MTTLMPAVRHTFGERVQKGNCYKTTYKRRSTKIPEQRIVADPDAQGFSEVGSGRDEAFGFAIAFTRFL